MNFASSELSTACRTILNKHDAALKWEEMDA
jgi:hypothetical protein